MRQVVVAWASKRPLSPAIRPLAVPPDHPINGLSSFLAEGSKIWLSAIRDHPQKQSNLRRRITLRYLRTSCTRPYEPVGQPPGMGFAPQVPLSAGGAVGSANLSFPAAMHQVRAED